MTYAPGTLVRVKDSALDGWLNADFAEKYGYLYIIEESVPSMYDEDYGYWCRSIAAGEGGLFWKEDEIEGADDDVRTGHPNQG